MGLKGFATRSLFEANAETAKAATSCRANSSNSGFEFASNHNTFYIIVTLRRLLDNVHILHVLGDSLQKAQRLIEHNGHCDACEILQSHML